MHKLSNVVRLIIFIALGIVIFILSNIVDEYRATQGATIAAYVVGISSIILLTGYSGQVSLGHGALMGVGGYAAALVGDQAGAKMMGDKEERVTYIHQYKGSHESQGQPTNY